MVLSSTGLNHSTSSRLKNMNLQVTTLLLIWKGWPDRTVLFTTTLLGSAESREPVASREWRPSGSSWNRGVSSLCWYRVRVQYLEDEDRGGWEAYGGVGGHDDDTLAEPPLVLVLVTVTVLAEGRTRSEPPPPALNHNEVRRV